MKMKQLKPRLIWLAPILFVIIIIMLLPQIINNLNGSTPNPSNHSPTSANTSTPTATHPAVFTIPLQVTNLSADFSQLRPGEYITLLLIEKEPEEGSGEHLEFADLKLKEILNENGVSFRYAGGKPDKILLEVSGDQRTKILERLQDKYVPYLFSQGLYTATPTHTLMPTTTPLPTTIISRDEIALSIPRELIQSGIAGFMNGDKIQVIFITKVTNLNGTPMPTPALYQHSQFEVILLEALDASGNPTNLFSEEVKSVRVQPSFGDVGDFATQLGLAAAVYFSPIPTPTATSSP